MKPNLILLCLSFSFSSHAAIHLVGPTKTYISPNALYQANLVNDGDTIYIDASTYIGQSALAVWSKNHLVIKGIGGKPSMVADGKNIWGKGIWVCAGNNISIENIAFSGAIVPDQNGAGIRLDGIGLTIRYCLFHDNENGILTSNPYDGDIVIEYSEFNHNGYGDGYSHNLYIGHVNKLIFRYNYSHHAKVGHNLKSRAKENYIAYNRIMDEEDGNSSRLVDIANGGYAVILGNLLMQGPNAENNNLIGYGKEGLESDVQNELYVIHNTMINKRTASCIFVDINDGVKECNVSNNIFGGTGITTKGKVTEFSNNISEPSISNLFLENESDYNYQLTAQSPAIDKATMASTSLGSIIKPDSSYKHISNFTLRNVINGLSDIGAYEFGSITGIETLKKTSFIVYPNPTTGEINTPEGFQLISILNNRGECFTLHKSNDLSHLKSGIYYLHLKNGNKIIISKVVKI